MEGLPIGGIFRQQWLILGAQGTSGLLKLNYMYKCLVILQMQVALVKVIKFWEKKVGIL